MDLIRNNTFNNEIILVDGHSGTGKSLISKVLEGFEGVEKSLEDEPFQLTQWLYRLKKIDKPTAIVMLRIWADRYLYNLMIGRNLNNRPTDVTTLDKCPNKQTYFDRMHLPDHDDVTQRIIQERPIFQNMSQNAIIEADIYFDAFGDRLKIIYIHRNLEDAIKNTMISNFGYRMGTDPTDLCLTLNYNGNPIPYYAHTWKEEYLNMDGIERVTKWIMQETSYANRSYNFLHEDLKKQIMFIDFEEFITHPYGQCERISNFIGRKPTNKLDDILKQQGCPRKL